MKIERVSENQLKLTLTKADLRERDINLEDLMNPTEKTQQLFRDLMEHALKEYDFFEENMPSMVEASPLGTDGIMIIVTKIKNTNKSDFILPNKDPRQWKEKGIEPTTVPLQITEDVLIYSFDTLDDTIRLCLRLLDNYKGESSLYKNYGRFFLVLNGHDSNETMDLFPLILDEYGQKHISNPLSHSYLLEHGETIISANAIFSLATTFSN